MKKSLDYGKTPVKNLFWKLFFPSLAGMMFNALFLIIDGVFVGRGIGPDALASVNLFEPALVLFLGIGAMIGTGCSVKASTQLASRDCEGARKCISSSIASAVVMTVAIALMLAVFRDSVLDFLGATPALHSMATDYLLWFFPTCVMMTFQIVGSYIIRLDGSPKYSMYANIIPNILNIILDYIFIIKLEWGLVGAAVATDIGFSVGTSMTLVYLLKYARTLKLDFHMKSISPFRVMKIGFPAFINEISAGTICLCGNLAFRRYLAEDGIAAFGVTCYLTPIIFSAYLSAVSSMQPIVSYSHGAGNRTRTWEAFRFGMLVSACMSATVALALFLFPSAIASVFIETGLDAHGMAAFGLKFYAVTYLFSGLNMTITTYYQSIERIKTATSLTVFRGFVLPAAAFALLPEFMGTAGLWSAVPATEVAVFTAGAISLLRLK